MESSLRQLRSELDGEYRILSSLVRANRVQHRRALYMHRILDVHRQLRLTLAASEDREIRAGRVELALAAAERTLEQIPSAWLKLRELIAQTYFMPFALCHLALLSRSASILAKMHLVLQATLGISNRQDHELPLLLGLHMTLDSGDTLLDRVFGSTAHSMAQLDHVPTQIQESRTTLVSAIDDDEEEDLGEGVHAESGRNLNIISCIDHQKYVKHAGAAKEERHLSNTSPMSSAENTARRAMASGGKGRLASADTLHVLKENHANGQETSNDFGDPSTRKCTVEMPQPKTILEGDPSYVASTSVDASALWELDLVGEADTLQMHCSEAISSNRRTRVSVGECGSSRLPKAADTETECASKLHVDDVTGLGGTSLAASATTTARNTKLRGMQRHTPRMGTHHDYRNYRKLLSTTSLLRRHMRY